MSSRPLITRVVLLVLDSVGIGELPDAAAYGDQGSDTLGNLAREVGLGLPSLRSLGLDHVANLGPPRGVPRGAVGRMAERSPGKDSVTGHWELMGLLIDRPFPVFPDGFPPSIIEEFERRVGRRSLGNKAASGTEIIAELGEEHLRTGAPIVYTSADSVFQIAAHEEVIPVPDLYRMCEMAFDIVSRGHGVGRVIARPFVGAPGHFQRTANRHDYALEPFGRTVLDHLVDGGWPVISVGKVRDLFAGRGISRANPTTSDEHGLDLIERELEQSPRGLVFANLVDSDAKFGHRNDPAGYAANLERIDARLPGLLARLGPQDVFIVTADHGNDPTTPSTDHSREYVPLLMMGPGIAPGTDLGTRATFADLGQTLAAIFDVAPTSAGTSFAAQLWPPG